MTLEQRYPFSTKLQRLNKGYAPNTEKFSCSSAKSHISPRKVVYGRLGQHGVILDLRLAQRGAVPGDEDQLGYVDEKEEDRERKTQVSIGTFSASGSSPKAKRDEIGRTFAIAHLLEGRFVAEGVLSRLDDERKTRCDRLCRLCGL
jgi:hypothetical protein